MEMEPSNPLKEIFDELFGLFEPLETQSMAVTQFLKDKKIGNDKKLAPYLEQVGNASSVKWRAARARMEYLLAPMQKEAEDKKKAAEKESEKHETKKSERTAGDKSATEIDDQADVVAASSGPSAKHAKKADPAPARPETKEKSKSEPKHK